MTMGIILVAVVVIAIVGFSVYVLRTLNRRKKQVVGHALCCFLTPQHTEFEMLLPVNENGIIQPPPEHKKIFEMNHIDPEARNYVIDERAVVTKMWPPGAMRLTQVEVKKVTFNVGYPVCVNPYTGEMMGMTPQFLSNLLNEVWSKVAAALGRETEKLLDLIAKAQGIFKPTVFYLLIAIAIIVGLIGCYMNYTNGQKMEELTQKIEQYQNPSGTP